MAQLGNYRIPREVEDEDKWFRYFTKKQLAVLVIVLLIDWKVCSFFYKLHCIVIGITLAILFLIIALAAVMIKMPRIKYLYGGIGLDILLIRIIIRKASSKHKKVYSVTMIVEDAES